MLAAGSGRRLAPWSDRVPKPLLPVLNVPLFAWMMSRFRRAGFQEVVANVYHLPSAFQDIVELGREHGPLVRLVSEERLTGPLGGAAKCAQALSRVSRAVVVSGDALVDLDVPAFIDAHIDGRAEMTIAITRVRDANRFGVLDLDGEGYVRGMREKPEHVRPLESISCGMYVINTSRLRIPQAEEAGTLDFVDLVGWILASGGRVGTYEVVGWRDIGSPMDLLEANLEYLHSSHLKAVATRHPASRGGEIWVQGDSKSARGLLTKGRVLIGRGSSIAPSAFVEDSILGPESSVHANAVVRRSVVLPNAVVSAGAQVIDEIVGPL